MSKTAVEILRTIKILSSLTEQDLILLYSHMNEEKHKKGHTLFNEGDFGDIMYIVLKGSLQSL